MRILAVDRFEGVYVICEDKNRKMYAIEAQEMPVGVQKGDIIVIAEDGTITVDADRTKAAKSKIKKLEDSVWN